MKEIECTACAGTGYTHRMVARADGKGDTVRDERCRECRGKGKVEVCRCGGVYYLSEYCGAWVCSNCNDHKGLVCCFCGWSKSGGDGYRELIEMGETIEEDY